MSIIQGSNNPLVIHFDADVSAIPRLVVTLWNSGMPGKNSGPLKIWEREDMTVNEDIAICPITEEETAGFTSTNVELLVKGLDSQGYTIFWDKYLLDITQRKDKIIQLTRNGGG